MNGRRPQSKAKMIYRCLGALLLVTTLSGCEEPPGRPSPENNGRGGQGLRTLADRRLRPEHALLFNDDRAHALREVLDIG